MILYHATYRKRIDQIRKYSLGARQPKNWENSEKGVIYFQSDYDIAKQFCEYAENVPDDVYNSGIVVLAVDTNMLKAENFSVDKDTTADGSQGCYIYRGTIAPQKIKVVQRKIRDGKVSEYYASLK